MDIILGDVDVAIEVKAGEHAASKLPKGLHLLGEECRPGESIIVSRDRYPEKINSRIMVMPWKQFCAKL